VILSQVRKSLNLHISPSAFQIRYGGCKGVVSICPELVGDQLNVRKSMEKFKSDHHELEVVQYTKPGNDLLFFVFFFHKLQIILLSLVVHLLLLYIGLYYY